LSSTWKAASFDLSSYAGKTIFLRFSFDTGDSVANTYEGWYVDDVQISSATANWTDYYSFAGSAGDTVSVALKDLTGGGANVFVEDASGTVLATGGTGATNFDQGISNLLLATGGIYYVRVSGSTAATYAALLLKNTTFDTEANDTFATAQAIGANQTILG